MKSRYDFGTDDQYYEYLVHYYVGQIASSVYGNTEIVEGITSASENGLDSDELMAEYTLWLSKAIVERIKNGV